ncbi:MAG: ribbon-helix-helix domain-containing protein [Egibacteraceae bacterium]
MQSPADGSLPDEVVRVLARDGPLPFEPLGEDPDDTAWDDELYALVDAVDPRGARECFPDEPTRRSRKPKPKGMNQLLGCAGAGARPHPGVRTGSYTSSMKTAVSIPDELFHKADELARRLRKSRSQVYQEAIAEYLLRRDRGAITQAMDEALENIEPAPDEWLTEAGRQALERSEW